MARKSAYTKQQTDLALSLRCYISADDYGLTRREFLEYVRDRIDMELKGLDLTKGEDA